ncbi:hypothetical protein KC363_g5221 [Hortaea werneckii]|uniref:Uncharacterized protein n=1 Tax=Hortaea werneckii TaxID=91943 RepID=A0A3M7FGG6_HORWE|nr:hypothetical protein KC361_g6044 [Hortaea werneckii]KAI6889513.1 hypothetical protein KC325_g523 [Hortaea werneckii]KAI6999344.1 hypothetical protein KC359_g1834 [Hortaea werneckii]KAI7144749.1 hypothetical protein KC344_g5078 [Hortaea werneckii]KAI7180188.1 hypothetical protein KC360_g303 [Hortaea werneckii]
MAEEHEFPILFTIEGSSRHEVLLTSPTQTLSTLRTHLTNLATTSPNCAEFMSKYRNRSITEAVSEIRVRWEIADPGTPAGSGRDGKIWPKETVVTEENFAAVMRLLEWGGGRDVLDVKMARGEGGEPEGEKGKGGK